jgi:4-amino-4-deoxy-L-arabinose transferase-like glycosyltransferase
MAFARLSQLGDDILISNKASRFARSSVVQCLVVFLAALAIRIWHITSANYLDHNGDSYHHWLTSYLTATHRYALIDFKGNISISWLPLYHYMIAFLMNTFQVYSLDVQHAFNILLGSLTCLLVLVLARESGSLGIGFAAGLALALQPWFVDITTLGVSEVSAIFLLTSGIYFFLRGKVTLSAIPVALAMLIRYEAWIFALVLLIVGMIQKRSTQKQFATYAIVCAAVVVGWSLISWIQTGQLTSWYTIQTATVRWDRLFTGTTGSIQEYLEMLVRMTSGMFLIGLCVGLLKNDRKAKLLLALELGYLLMIVFQYFRGTVPFQARFLSYLFPLTAVLSPSIVKFSSKLLRRQNYRFVVSFLILTMIVVYPVYDQYWTILSPKVDQTQFDRHVAAELIAGKLLGETYTNGTVLCDSPTIIYYSHLDPSKFLSTNELEWYTRTWSKSELASWIGIHEVRYLIWQNVSYSSSWWMFPELSNGSELRVFFGNNQQMMFKMIAWTSSDYGPIYIYETIVS